MFEPYQVAEARAWGADCILIIMAAVDDATARAWKTPPSPTAWTCWSKCTTKMNSSARCKLKSRLIGINNRDLKTFETTLATSERLAPKIPRGRIVVGESGLFTPADLARLAKVGISTFLIGESLMRQKDVAAATKALLARHRAHASRRGVSRWRTKLTHLGKRGEARMVDVSDKAATERIAVAEGRVVMAQVDARSRAHGRRQERRRAGRRAHRRHHGGEAHA